MEQTLYHTFAKLNFQINFQIKRYLTVDLLPKSFLTLGLRRFTGKQLFVNVDFRKTRKAHLESSYVWERKKKFTTPLLLILYVRDANLLFFPFFLFASFTDKVAL